MPVLRGKQREQQRQQKQSPQSGLKVRREVFERLQQRFGEFDVDENCERGGGVIDWLSNIGQTAWMNGGRGSTCGAVYPVQIIPA